MTGTQSTGTPSEDKRKNTGHFLNIPAHRLLEDPERVFSYDEYHYENHKGCLYAVISFLPWILAVLFLFILQVKLPFFRLCGMQRAPAPDRIQIP